MAEIGCVGGWMFEVAKFEVEKFEVVKGYVRPQP
jgi:hypothetical protein